MVDRVDMHGIVSLLRGVPIRMDDSDLAKSAEEINRMPPTWLPDVWHLKNYAEAWLKPESTFQRYFVNTVIIAGVGTALQLLVCADRFCYYTFYISWS